MSPGRSIGHPVDHSQKSPAVSAVESEFECLWQPGTNPRKRRAMGRSTRTNSSRRKRHKRDSTALVNRMHSSAPAFSSLASPLLCSKCSALVPPTLSTSDLDQEPMRLLPRQPDLGRYTPYSEVSSDTNGSAVPNEYLRKSTQHRRSRSSVLGDLVQNIETRSTKRMPRIRKKRPINEFISAIDRFIAEVNNEEQSPASESDSESAIGSGDIVWDDRQSPSTQSPELECDSPIKR